MVVVNEVGKASEIANPRQAANRWDGDEKAVVVLDSPGGRQSPSEAFAASPLGDVIVRHRARADC
jgi:hypothetical protein